MEKSNESCYRHEIIATCDDPMLPSVSTAIILTMENAAVRHAEIRKAMPTLGRLCPRLIMQYNRGFAQCSKPRRVDNTAHDILHAYRAAFETLRDEERVLVLEDDVQFDTADLPRHLARVDNFVLTRRFQAYSLGSICLCLWPVAGVHRRILGVWKALQAVIWSRSARDGVLERLDFDAITPNEIWHMDSQTIFPHLKRDCYTYHRAIATQLFPVTENFHSWCVRCKELNNPRTRRIHQAYLQFMKWFFKRQKLDQQTRPGWDNMYGLCGLGLIGGNVLISVCVVLVIVAIVTTAVLLSRSKGKQLPRQCVAHSV